MKKLSLWLLCVIIVLTGCSGEIQPSASEMTHPVNFYYLSEESRFHSSLGPMGVESRDLGTNSSMEQIMSLYVSGPSSEKLRSPFAPGAAMEEVVLDGSVLFLTPNDAFFALQGTDLTLAAACIVHTMTQFAEVEAVVLQASNARFTGLVNRELTTEDFILSAGPEDGLEHMISLFFPTKDSRSLTEETVSYPEEEDPEELSAFALRQMLDGPKEDGLPVFPKGTNLLDVRVQDGNCTLNLSSDFLDNRPETAMKTRMALLAVVNTLTAIDGVDRVCFVCENQVISDYNGFDLSSPFEREESAIAVYTNSAARDVTLFLPYGSGEKLISIPVQVRKSTGKGAEKDVLGALLSYQSSNGVINPIPEDTMIASLDVKNGLCQVTFNSVLALADKDPWQAEMSVRSVVATLCALPSVDQVQISIDGNTMTSVDISEPLTAMWQWIAP